MVVRASLIIAIVLSMLLVAAPLALGLYKGIERHEKAECFEWVRQAETHQEHFYLLEWQAEQCAHHGIPVDGIPVK